MTEPIAIPALDSNYFWLLPCAEGSLRSAEGSLQSTEGYQRRAYLVDPGDAQPVFDALERYQLTLVGILVTHHHWDHTDGLDDLLARHPVPVYGPGSIRQVDHPLTEGDHLGLESWQFDILAVPGHTLDHIAYLDRQQAPPRLFCGDALFAGGCGRLFEGSPEMALESLHKLDALPDETLVYCAHEYTLTNLRFARTVDPSNRALSDRLPLEEQKRAQGQPTLPTSMGVERKTNPFLRADDAAIRAQLASANAPLSSELEVFTRLRQLKDRFG